MFRHKIAHPLCTSFAVLLVILPLGCDQSGEVVELGTSTKVEFVDCDLGPDADCDFDGYAGAVDCNDTNGAIYPGASEYCNGLDDDCDGVIDEGFDADGDGFGPCALNVAEVDCDDANPDVHPGRTDTCGDDGMGDGVDENCNGHVDEGCGDCDPIDEDGDGFSVCDGDCEPKDPHVYPGAKEVCDGKDTDCNSNTVKNCVDGETCFGPMPDECVDDSVCACQLVDGLCVRPYVCTSFCNSSNTGPPGEGCAERSSCSASVLGSADIKACVLGSQELGGKLGGAACREDSECRSGVCSSRDCVRDECNDTYCLDRCGADLFCDRSAVCRIETIDHALEGWCTPTSKKARLGAVAVGDPCRFDADCDHGFCSRTSKTCMQTCCADSDCNDGSVCQVGWELIETNFRLKPDRPDACRESKDCEFGPCINGLCWVTLVETIPACVLAPEDLGHRHAGAACAKNSDCASNFCEATFQICVSTCCSDASCPTGTTCRQELVATSEDSFTQARVCAPIGFGGVLAPMGIP